MGESDTQNKKGQRENNRRSIKIKVPNISIAKAALPHPYREAKKNH
jgi:hypothetical protein